MNLIGFVGRRRRKAIRNDSWSSTRGTDGEAPPSIHEAARAHASCVDTYPPAFICWMIAA
jgi:hypothetical protein